MVRSRVAFSEGAQVICSGIPLVRFPVKRGIPRRELLHQVVAYALCQDGRRGYRLTDPVSPDYRFVRHAKLRQRRAVNQNMIGSYGESLERAPHGERAGATDVDAAALTSSATRSRSDGLISFESLSPSIAA